MKKILATICVVIILGAVAAWIYWQENKKRIVRNVIENKVSKGTDSLYFIKYDSSHIDELGGNASFYRIALQSDSLQKQLMQFDTAASSEIYNVHVDELSVGGVNVIALLSNTAVDAKTIRIIRPVLYIISAGKKEKKSLSITEHEALYKRMLGKYNTIKAGEIIIENGSMFFTDKSGIPYTSVTGINMQFKNFSINSDKDYQNIPSYFIKDVVANVKEINIKRETRQTVLSDVEYNAPGKFIRLKKIQQKDNNGQIVHDINNTYITNISTDSFILNQQLKAGELSSEGGTLSFFIKKRAETANTGNDEIEMDPVYFDEAVLNKITLGNTRVFIWNAAKPSEPPVQISNVKFEASDIQKVYSGTSIKNVIGRSNWSVSGDGFSLMTADKRYQMKAGRFDINKENGTMRISSFSVIPQVTEEAFARSLQYQDDLYNLQFNNISLTGVDARLLITQRRLEAETATLQPNIKVFNDRTVTPSPESKVGMYPQQLLQKVKFPLHIKRLIVNNGSVTYKERGALSKQTGLVTFKNVNGTITNVTNIKDVIAQNNTLELNASARFMDVSNVTTNWKLKLNDAGGLFNVTGSFTGFNAPDMNKVTEPLGMVSIKKGRINKLTFNLDGTNYKAWGISTILYDNLKISILKKDPTIERAGVRSFLANIFIKDSNSKEGEPVNWDRDTHKSFFNLIWQTIFAATKQTAQKKL